MMAKYQVLSDGIVKSNPLSRSYSETAGFNQILEYGIANKFDISRGDVKKGYSIQYRIGRATLIIVPSEREPIGSEAKTLSHLVADNLDDFKQAAAILESAFCAYAVNEMNNSKTEQRRIRRIFARANNFSSKK